MDTLLSKEATGRSFQQGCAFVDIFISKVTTGWGFQQGRAFLESFASKETTGRCVQQGRAFMDSFVSKETAGQHFQQGCALGGLGTPWMSLGMPWEALGTAWRALRGWRGRFQKAIFRIVEIFKIWPTFKKVLQNTWAPPGGSLGRPWASFARPLGNLGPL